MIWSMLESKEKASDDGQITWISQLQPEFSSHFKEIIPSSKLLVFLAGTLSFNQENHEQTTTWLSPQPGKLL